MASRTDVIVVDRGSGKQPWWWAHKGSNGRTICVSEQFPSRGNALRAAKAQKRRLKGPVVIQVLG